MATEIEEGEVQLPSTCTGTGAAVIPRDIDVKSFELTSVRAVKDTMSKATIVTELVSLRMLCNADTWTVVPAGNGGMNTKRNGNVNNTRLTAACLLAGIFMPRCDVDTVARMS